MATGAVVIRRLLLLAVVLLLAALASVRAFLLPLSSRPTYVDVVLVVGPIYNDSRFALAQSLVRRHPGAVLLVSVDDPRDCDERSAPGAAQLVCFRPDPFTTQGEARAAGEVVRGRHLSSVLVVAPPDQLERARLRVERCVPGPVLAIASPRPSSVIRSLFLYQNAAMLKAYVQPSC